MTNILGVVILVNCGQMDGRHVAISTLDRRVLKNTNLKHVIRTLEWPAICCISPVKGNHNDRSHLPHIFNICFWRIGHFTLLLAKGPWAMSNPRVYGLSLIASVSSLSSIKQIFFSCKLFVRLVSPSISTIKLEYVTESQGRRQEIVGSHLHS